MNDNASWKFENQRADSMWAPSLVNERINATHCATQAVNRSEPVNDAGALAPVVFSGEEDVQTCKITRIKRKGRPSPPKSDLLNALVALVLAESACTGRFEASQLGNPKHGNTRFWRSTSQTIAQIHPLVSHEHIASIRIH